jgi:hypothetical protein
MSSIALLLEIIQATYRKGAEAEGALGEQISPFVNLMAAIDPDSAQAPCDTDIPYLETLRPFVERANRQGAGDLANAFLDAAPLLNWSRYYAGAPWNRKFLPHFTNASIVGPVGVILSDDLLVNVCVLGPDLLHPPHGHKAEEMAYIVSGWPTVQTGEDEPKACAPGSFVRQAPDVPQTTWSGPDGVFNVIAWRGDLYSPAWRSESTADVASALVPMNRIATEQGWEDLSR